MNNPRQRSAMWLLAACFVSAIAVERAVASDTAKPRNLAKVVDSGGLPVRVHVFEDYETEIEKRWWLRGTPQTDNVPPTLSKSIGNRRISRASMSKDFDRRMMNQTKMHKAVIFNPVPGPPMAGNTRLFFRYWLKGTDTLRVQLYSLSNNYHRHLVLTGLPQSEWQTATVDMTEARRPDGSGGPLAKDERIDDIQFYIDPKADLLIDDIVLYEAALKTETRPFPRRVIFTGWFDTGKQGAEWPGDFDIVLHKKPLTWDAARSVINKQTGKPWIRVNMRGLRPLSQNTHVRFRYRLSTSCDLQVVIANSKTKQRFRAKVESPAVGEWTEVDLPFEIGTSQPGTATQADELQFLIDKDAELLIDDVLVYEPGNAAGSADAAQQTTDDKLLQAATLYASFDKHANADFGGGDLTLSTRMNDKTEKGKHVITKGISDAAFQVVAAKGVHGGALNCSDVLPNRGRIFFPARGNIAFKKGGWGGSVSLWINTNPNTSLKTRFCDPVQITQKNSHNGGIWFDFTPDKPRDLRMGTFPGLAEGEKLPKVPESEQPLHRVKAIGFKTGEWHHVVIAWNNFDTGKKNSLSKLYIDGKPIGVVSNHDLHMDWDLDKTGIYIAINYIGLFDEFAVFNRELTAHEVARLHQQPGLLSGLKGRKSKSTASKTSATSPKLQDAARRLTNLSGRKLGASDSPPFPFKRETAQAYQRAFAAQHSLPVEVADELETPLVLIPPGKFLMGSPPDEVGRKDDEELHSVTLTQPFFLGRTEVTVGQFRRFVTETNYVTDGFAFPAPVASYQCNAFGIHDMLGNVWEFCSARAGAYSTEHAVDPGDLSDKRGFAVRGGGWSNEDHDVPCATRNADPPHFCHSNLGFRVALVIK